jgi:phosphorylcholine metabolism protein LicD
MRSKNSSKEKVDLNFIEVINLLKKSRISYWLCHGTLLGIIRDGNLIPWDHDIDIAVWCKKDIKKKLKKLMLKNKFKLKKKYFVEDDLLTFIKKGGREVDINFYHRKIINSEQMAYVKWYIPKNFFFKIIDALSAASIYKGKLDFLINKLKLTEPAFHWLKIILIKNNIFYKTLGYTQPLNLLKNFKEIKFKGLSVSVPYFSEEYLKYVYGPNWKKPIKKYNWIKDSSSTKEV